MSMLRLFVLAALLSGCADYRFSVNERVVYNPDPLFSDYQIPDPGLRTCVESHIARTKISSAAELKELDCRDSNVVRLQGLQVFVSLAYLNLEGNAALHCQDLLLPGIPRGNGVSAPEHCPR